MTQAYEVSTFHVVWSCLTSHTNQIVLKTNMNIPSCETWVRNSQYYNSQCRCISIAKSIFSKCRTSVFDPLTPNDFWRRRAVIPLNRRTTYKDVANSVSNLGGILFTLIWNTAVFWYAAGTLKVRVSLCSQNGPPLPPKPLQIPIHMVTHSNCAVISVRNAVWETAHLVYHSPCSSLWVEASTLAYESNSSCCPKRLSVA
jgi:hypothetical protein